MLVRRSIWNWNLLPRRYGAGPSARAGALRRLRAQWRQITRRDFFPPPERDRARAALHALAATTEEMPRNDAEEVSR